MAEERIEGTVTDQYQQTLPGVTLILTREENSEKVEQITREDGRFVFTRVVPGEYTLKAQMNKKLAGFKTSEQRITLGVDEVLQLSIVLQNDHGRY